MNEEEAQKIDEKIQNEEDLTFEELKLRLEYDVKLFRQVMPIDDVYDFAYDVVTFIKINKEILCVLLEKIPKEELTEILHPFKKYLSFLNKIYDKAYSVQEELLEFRKKLIK